MSPALSLVKKRFGLAVRQSRLQRGWSQEQLAEAADLNRSYLGQIERGEVAASLVTAAQLAAAFGLNLSALVGRGEQAAAPTLACHAGGDSL